MVFSSQFLVIGSGIAGLSFALRAAEYGTVHIVTKKSEFDSNTNYAQGGIASVVEETDSFEHHIEDTLIAGAGLCNEDAVRAMVKEGPEAIKQLMDWGVEFTRKSSGELSLAKEGGHSSHRIVHAADLTGQEIERALVNAIHSHPNISLFTNHFAIDFITEHQIKRQHNHKSQSCFGCYAYEEATGSVHTFSATYTILCSGGAGQVYLHTTNPTVATGDGVAMAFRAGCQIENLEFMQFHPTSLYLPDGGGRENSFLISEAVRGFGGVLRNHRGDAFMEKYDDRKDLAPRDIVARAIDTEMKKFGLDFVHLDITHKDPDEIKIHFPNIYKTCMDYHLDITKEPIPVVPSAHYTCGGVKTDINGQTSLKNLYACGEVASTGIHGANRLASNSLLEAVVFAKRIFNALDLTQTAPQHHIPDWDTSGTINHEEWGMISHDKKSIQQMMWGYVGIVRSTFRLERAYRRIDLIHSEIEAFYKKSVIFPDLLELRNLTCVANLIIRCALKRKESRGLHFTTNYPKRSERYNKNTTIRSSRFKT